MVGVAKHAKRLDYIFFRFAKTSYARHNGSFIPWDKPIDIDVSMLEVRILVFEEILPLSCLDLKVLLYLVI